MVDRAAGGGCAICDEGLISAGADETIGAMRTAFAHDAALIMGPGADLAAPGAAVTVALCGHWKHEPPCPRAPHHTSAARTGDEVWVRILFAAEPDVEGVVRERIDSALSSGRLLGPTGVLTSWQLRSSQSGHLLAGEVDQAEWLRQS